MIMSRASWNSYQDGWPRFERHQLDTPASWWRWEQEVAPGKAEHAMAYMRAWNPFDRKFSQLPEDESAGVPQIGPERPLESPNSPSVDVTTLRDRSKGPSRASSEHPYDEAERRLNEGTAARSDPNVRYETISDGPVKNGWRVNLIGWIKDHRP